MSAQEIYARLNPPKKSPKFFTSLALLVGVLVALLVFVLFFSPKQSYSYTTAHPTNLTITQVVSATGTLSPTDTVEVGSQISGRIEAVYVDINDEVTQGQVLAKIDPEKLNQTLAKYKANLASARSQYELSKNTLAKNEWNYNRLKELYERTGGKSPSQLELKTAQIEYETAKSTLRVNASNIANIESDVRSSEIDLRNAIIISPINGIVLERSVDAGQTVAANFQAPTLFKLAKSIEMMSLVVNVAESDIGKVKKGQEVRFFVDAYPDVEFSALVDRVSYASVEDSTNNIVSYETKILVDNKSLLLRPGMSASANIRVETQKDAQSIPVGALYFDPPREREQAKKAFSFGGNMPRPPRSNITKSKKMGKTIYILKDGKPQPIEVEVGINDGTNVHIISPILPKDTQVILSSQAKSKK